MGISVELPTYISGYKQSVLANKSSPYSKLKKKSSSIAFHFVREGVAKSEWKTIYLNTNLNASDMLTKTLPGQEKRSRFTSLHYVGDWQQSQLYFKSNLGGIDMFLKSVLNHQLTTYF